jgi:hypothetical protein
MLNESEMTLIKKDEESLPLIKSHIEPAYGDEDQLETSKL